MAEKIMAGIILIIMVVVLVVLIGFFIAEGKKTKARIECKQDCLYQSENMVLVERCKLECNKEN